MITHLQLVVDMPVEYRLISGGSGFAVDPSGRVTLSGTLDRELSAAHSLAVLALTESSPPLTAVTEITLQVLDTNDNAPVFDSEVYNIGIPENVAEGTSVFKGVLTVHNLHLYNIVHKRLSQVFQNKWWWYLVNHFQINTIFRLMKECWNSLVSEDGKYGLTENVHNLHE